MTFDEVVTVQAGQGVPRAFRGHALPVLICVSYFLVVAHVAQLRVVGGYSTETDFYQLYAPDADRIGSGRFPENTYNGPGYPTLLVLVSRLTGDHFTSAKWLSVTSAPLTGLMAFYLFRRLFGYRTASLALPLLLVSGTFPRLAVRAVTDIVFLSFCVAVLLIFTSDRIGPWARAALTGVLSGVAYLIRYNGVFLLPVCLVGIVGLNTFAEPLPRRLKIAALYVLCFLVTVSPWLSLNYTHHGSPIYNTNYLNTAATFYTGRTDQDGTRPLSDVFHSFGDVVRYQPARFVRAYLSQLIVAFWYTLDGRLAGIPGVFAVAGAVLVLLRGRAKRTTFLLLSAVLFFLLMAFNHWETRYYLFLAICYAGLGSYFVVALLNWAQKKWAVSERTARLVFLIISISMVSWLSVKAYNEMVRMLGTQPYEVLGARDYLQRVATPGTRIMARKPHVAYLSRGEWVFLPPVHSVDALRTAIQREPVQYLVYDRPSLGLCPSLKALANPQNGIPWLRPVFVDADRSFVLYRVELVDDPTASETRQ